jgi:NAD(P) transhydrogenase
VGIPYSKLRIGVPRETFQNERRVGLVPATVATLTKKGFNVTVEDGAGELAKFSNVDYENAGGKIGKVDDIYNADMILKVRSSSIRNIVVYLLSDIRSVD